MQTTSTVVNACDAVIELEDDGGIMREISGSSNEVLIDFDNDLGDYKAFGNRWKGRLECGSDAVFKLKFLYSTAANEALDIWKSWFFGTRGHRRIKVYIPAKITGADIYEADVFLGKTTGIGGNAGTAGPIMPSIECKPHLGVAHNTYGS